MFPSDTQPGKPYTYDRYYARFNEARDALGLNKNHRPHDGRVQFATMAKKSEVDQYALKKYLAITLMTSQRNTTSSPIWTGFELKSRRSSNQMNPNVGVREIHHVGF